MSASAAARQRCGERRDGVVGPIAPRRVSTIADDYLWYADQYVIDRRIAHANFLEAKRHQRSLVRYQRSRVLCPTDHSIHFLTTPCFITDDGVVDFGLEESPLTPFFYKGTTTYNGDDDAHS
ncbi:hypothetical protein Syun_012274 [Stephania yunnanensis]|uniref:Uncharacterized protein n=1 Tax=Stephania yunnanensis TaxID=152371 RepID=A0AAP0JZY0_9MAGN